MKKTKQNDIYEQLSFIEEDNPDDKRIQEIRERLEKGERAGEIEEMIYDVDDDYDTFLHLYLWRMQNAP